MAAQMANRDQDGYKVCAAFASSVGCCPLVEKDKFQVQGRTNQYVARACGWTNSSVACGLGGCEAPHPDAPCLLLSL